MPKQTPAEKEAREAGVVIPTSSRPPRTPVTLDEMSTVAEKRISAITKEFKAGFEFLRNYGKSVTFFGSSRLPKESPYYRQAESLARKIVSDLGYSVFTGGGPGIMEAAAKGAFEAGGKSLGITIHLPRPQLNNSYLSDQIDFHYFFSRKVCLSFSAEAYIFLPGGFGTFDELFEILTLVQTEKIKEVPVILVGQDFWLSAHEFMKKEMVSRGMLSEQELNLYTITDDEAKIIDIIKKVPIREGVPYRSDQA